jgi:hypothetical protein
MPTINGTFRLRPRPEDFARCVWCDDWTDFRMKTPGRPDLGEVPLHAFCAAQVIVAFEDFAAARRLDAGAQPPLRLARLLDRPTPA